MKTILNKSGKVIFSTNENYNCSNDEMFTELQLTEFMINPYFDFEKNEFYDAATEVEKLNRKKELNKQSYDKLIETDWYIIRHIETGKEIPADILEIRNNIRNETD